MRKIIFLALVIALIQSCGSSSNDSSGAANSGTSGNPSTRQASATPLTASFNSISQNVFAPKCLSCHGSAEASGGVDLTSYDSLVHNTRHMDLITPGKPEQSHLYEMLSTGQMPPNGPALSAAELQSISDWISQGAQNN